MSHPDIRRPHYETQVANSWRGKLDSFRRGSLSAVADLLSPLLRYRADLMGKIGTTFGGSRKLYSIFGWPLTPDYDWYKHLYDRGGIAKRIIDAYPYATWRNAPEIKEEKESGAKDTRFEKDWKELCKRKRIFHYLQRVDRMARLGEFAILFIGYNDGAGYDNLSQPVGAVRGSTPWDKLLYLQPYSEKNAVVSTWDNDPSSPRFGLPKLYTVNIQSPQLGGSIKSITRTVRVHHTRILHVAEDVFENDSEGTPALRPALNLLLDLEKVLGASAEAFYQQTPPGTVFNAQADSTHDASTLSDTDMETLVDDFINGFRRYLFVKGMDVKTIQSTLGDPSKLYSCLIELLAGVAGIPKRILTGSEMGELASSQDETNWNSRIEERQLNWAEPFVLMPLIEEFISKGVISPPTNVDSSFTCEWKSQQVLGEQAKAEVSDKKAGAIQKYCGSPDAQEIVPPDVFLEEVMCFSSETVERIKKTREEIWDKELEDMLKDDETLAEEEKSRGEILGEGPNRPPVQVQEALIIDEVIPFADRSAEEQQLIEEYNRTITTRDWEMAYTEEDNPHWLEDSNPSPLAGELLRDLARFGVEKPATILEIGIGNGRDSIYFAQAGHNVMGIDVAQAAVDRAKVNLSRVRGLTTSVDFEQGDAEHLAFGDGTFDAVYSIAALHSSALRFSMREIFRILKPGGIAKLFLYTRTKTGSRWISYWTPGEIKQFAKEEGFKVKKFRESTDNNPITIPGVTGEIEQETHIVITTLQKPKRVSADAE